MKHSSETGARDGLPAVVGSVEIIDRCGGGSMM